MKIRSFDRAHDALHSMTEQLAGLIRQQSDRPFRLALSGGSTAQHLFRLWEQQYALSIPWDRLRFYWVDERCVPPGDPQSNFRHADEMLLQPLGIPADHIFRIRGEENPEQEALRYAGIVTETVPSHDGMPRFDAIVLGIGDDGHTASIFPGETSRLLTEPECYAASQHPVSGQQRVTMTGPTILNGTELFFPAIGSEKTAILRTLTGEHSGDYPAGYILRRAPQATVYTDCPI